MIKIFIATIFFAELVLAVNFILCIWKFDRKVNEVNNIVVGSRVYIKTFFLDLHSLLEECALIFEDTIEYIKQKKLEYTQTAVKKFIFYSGLIFLRGKYKRAFIAYKLMKEVYKGYKAGINLS